jgi:hypothetical protein
LRELSFRKNLVREKPHVVVVDLQRHDFTCRSNTDALRDRSFRASVLRDP